MNKNENVGICVPVTKNDFLFQFFLENLFKKTQGNFTIHLLDFQGKLNDDELVRKIIGKNDCTIYDVSKLGLATAFNNWLSDSECTYGCFLHPNIIVNNNWLNDLIHAYEGFENSGVVGIKPHSNNLKLTSLLFTDADDEEMRTIYVNDSHFVNDLVFFKTKRAINVGYFDTAEELKGAEMNDWSFRFFQKGFNNYFLKYQNVIKINMECDILYPSMTSDAIAFLKSKLNKIVTIETYDDGRNE